MIEGDPSQGGPTTSFRGGSSWTTATSSDSRLGGTITDSSSTDIYEVGRDAQIVVSALTTRIENEGGAWSGTTFGFYDSAAAKESDPTTDILTLVGSGDYEGLNAVIQIIGSDESCEYTFRGMIADRELPPVPEETAAE